MSDITDPDPRHLRETMIMLNRAIVNGWHIPDAVMSAAPLVVGRMLRDGTARESGASLRQIASRLNDGGIETAQGSIWRAQQVASVLSVAATRKTA